MSQSPLASAADQAEALLVARKAKNLVFLLLLLLLLGQLVLFFLVRYEVFGIHPAQPAAPATQPAGPLPAPASDSDPTDLALHYAVGLTAYLGVILSLLLIFILFLLTMIMLVARLLGSGPVTGALLGSVLLAAMLFPWQALLSNVGLTAAQADFKIPGVLYSWAELSRRADFGGDIYRNILGWARFVGFPILALLLMIWVQRRSARGLRLALGEETPPAE